MQITASLVKEMRDRTGLGMMECKKALVEADGDIEAAIDTMRKSGAAKADKKVGRTAAEGALAFATSDRAAVLLEVNCETDFVAKDENFTAFIGRLASLVLEQQPADIEGLKQLDLDGVPVEEARQQLVGRIGENIQLRRFVRRSTSAGLGHYLHGHRIGVLVEVDGGDEALWRDLAMHIAASAPLCVQESDIPAEVLERERGIYFAQAAESGKPEEIQAKMVEGKVRKFAAEQTLLGQPFVKDPDTTVGKLLQQAGAQVLSFDRLVVGEGIEKEEDDFVAEVMKQAKA